MAHEYSIGLIIITSIMDAKHLRNIKSRTLLIPYVKNVL